MCNDCTCQWQRHTGILWLTPPHSRVHVGQKSSWQRSRLADRKGTPPYLNELKIAHAASATQSTQPLVLFAFEHASLKRLLSSKVFTLRPSRLCCHKTLM